MSIPAKAASFNRRTQRASVAPPTVAGSLAPLIDLPQQFFGRKLPIGLPTLTTFWSPFHPVHAIQDLIHGTAFRQFANGFTDCVFGGLHGDLLHC